MILVLIGKERSFSVAMGLFDLTTAVQGETVNKSFKYWKKCAESSSFCFSPTPTFNFPGG